MAKGKRTNPSRQPIQREEAGQQMVLALTFTFNAAETGRIDEALIAKYGKHVSNITPENLDGMAATITQAPRIDVVVLGERLEYAQVGFSGRTYAQEIRGYFQTTGKRAPQIMVRDRVSRELRPCQG